MAGDYGLAALSGILGGLAGLPQGMVQREKMDQTQQQLDEQKRQFDEGRFTDLSAVAPLLKAGGMDVSALPSGKVPNAILPTLLSLQQKRADQADKAGAAQDIQRQLLEHGTSYGMAPGAALAMPQPGELLTPPTTAPAPPISQQRVDPGMATLAKMIPGLLRTDPAAVTSLLKDQFAPQKPIALGENATLVDPRTGQPIGPGRPQEEVPPFTPGPGYQPVPTLDARGRVKSTRYEPPSTARQIAEGALKDKGWTPDMPGYGEALYQLMTPLTPIAEGGAAVPRTFSVPSPPARTSAIDPNVPVGQQPIVQAAGRNLSNALSNMSAAAAGLPGVPPPQGPGGIQRMPGGGVKGPEKSQALPAVEAEKMGTFKTLLGMLDQADKLYNEDFVGPVSGRLGALRQKTDKLPLVGAATPQETEFRSTLQSIANQLLYMRSGAAVTPQEYDRIISELPTANDPPGVFRTKLATARKILQETLKNRETEFSQRGFRGGQEAPGPSPSGPQRRRFNPATGVLE
jgi:hypothetical protein